VGAWVLGGQGRGGRLLLEVLGGMLASHGIGETAEEHRAEHESK
jgi:hypothetical protein